MIFLYSKGDNDIKYLTKGKCSINSSCRDQIANIRWIMEKAREFQKNIYAMLCYAKSLQLCLTLCDPIDGSPPGSPIPGILQASTLEWVAISFSNAGK